jgi:hypothetical protein
VPVFQQQVVDFLVEGNGTLAFVGGPRFQFKIEPNTPVQKLLPVPPRLEKSAGPVLDGVLAHVPEVQFQLPLGKELPNDEALKQTAHMIARINHINARKTDGFLDALLAARGDLDGLPFAMGDACRTKGDRSRQFAAEVALVHSALPRRQTAVSFIDVVSPVHIGAITTAVQPAPPLPPPTIQPPPPSGPPLAPSATSGSRTTPKPAPPAAAAGAGSGPRPTQASVPTPQPAPAPPMAVETVRVERAVSVVEQGAAENFWERYPAACAQEDKKPSSTDPSLRVSTRIAALMQVLVPEAPALRLGLVKYLSTISHKEATRGLARLALFSSEEEIRKAAVDALKVRRERDYSDLLLYGLRYPWPAVARRAAEAMVQLERTDMVPQLVDFLDEPDPRAPVAHTVSQKKVPVVRELVRINHHRNCLLCHAPGNTGAVAPQTLTAAVPVPNQPLPSPGEGYQNSLPDVLVRIDVTYLRQDFSMLQPVADAHPWPEMQRFDFLVRTRSLTEAEAASYRAKLTPREPGRLSPYHRAALYALRELTGRDTEPTADAWRRLLDLPAPKALRVATR